MENGGMTKTIGLITSVLVLALAVAAFVLSYDALRGLAADNGVKAQLAWIWPFVIDGFLIVASLSVLRNGLLGERALYQWSLVALFTAASIAFNIAHAPENLLARVVGATPPVALALAFELLMGQLKSEVKRGRAVKSLAKLEEQGRKLEQRLEQMRNANAGLEEQRHELEEDLEDLERKLEERHQKLERGLERNLEEPGQNLEQSLELGQIQDLLNQANLSRREKAELATQALLKFYDEKPDAPQSEAAEFVNRSPSWVSRTLGELEEEGTVKRNGGGVLVSGEC
jgi:archaellum component FlaC